MSTRGRVGVAHADGTVSVRYVHGDATMDYLPFAIAAIWWRTFSQDTERTVAALLEHDWEDLDPTTLPDSAHWTGAQPVAGVGMRIEPALTEGPVTGAPGTAAQEGLLFLLDPARPGLLIVTDGTSSDLTTMPVFDLRVGEHVVIPQR